MIIFRNPGIIDIRALTTFGLSSKAGQDKIGRFGTGLKYATAVIMRHGGTMAIDAAGEQFKIGHMAETFRDRDITQLTMNGAPLPFTTDLGRDWEVWQAFRELYSNALDEGGDVMRGESMADACGEETVINVDLAAFEAIFFSMEEHFIGKDETPVSVSDGLEVYQGRSLFVFYRGIAIMKLKEPAAYRYNLKGYIDLTEDRTAKYDWQVKSHLAAALAATESNAISMAAVDQRNAFEAGLDFSNATPSKVFLGASISTGVNCNPTAMALVKAQLPTDKDQYTVYSASDPGAETFGNAMAILRATGADLSKCVFVLAAGVNFYGDFDVRSGKVFINQDIFLKQDRMNIAVIEGYAEVIGMHWLAKQLIENVGVAT